MENRSERVYQLNCLWYSHYTVIITNTYAYQPSSVFLVDVYYKKERYMACWKRKKSSLPLRLACFSIPLFTFYLFFAICIAVG